MSCLQAARLLIKIHWDDAVYQLVGSENAQYLSVLRWNLPRKRHCNQGTSFEQVNRSTNRPRCLTWAYRMIPRRLYRAWQRVIRNSSNAYMILEGWEFRYAGMLFTAVLERDMQASETFTGVNLSLLPTITL